MLEVVLKAKHTITYETDVLASLVSLSIKHTHTHTHTHTHKYKSPNCDKSYEKFYEKWEHRTGPAIRISP